MVRVELTTSGFEDQRSIPLSYTGVPSEGVEPSSLYGRHVLNVVCLPDFTTTASSLFCCDLQGLAPDELELIDED